jgi:hypothetical protein
MVRKEGEIKNTMSSIPRTPSIPDYRAIAYFETNFNL